MEYIKNLKDLNKNDVAYAGGKGASLGEMVKAGIPVPPGFVVLSNAFDKFIIDEKLTSEIEAILAGVNHEDVNSVTFASKKIRSLILSAGFHEELSHDIKKYFHKLDSVYVAVRSSATMEDSAAASWAGELESFLYTAESSLLKNIRCCWASLFTPRAIYYRIANNLQKDNVSVAVVVQAMIKSEVSGICFTTHPITKNPNQLLIEAGLGLGEAIVSGSITPDNYVVNKSNLAIDEITISKQETLISGTKEGTEEVRVEKSRQETQKLCGSDIIDLAKICINIEKHFGFPCDIEWALADGKIYITQSRPITTLLK